MNYPETNETPVAEAEVSDQNTLGSSRVERNHTTISNAAFLSAIFGPFGWQNSHVTAFSCPPEQSTVVSWAGQYAKDSSVLENAALNQYFTVSLFNPDGSNKSRRRKDDFKEQCCTVLDDLGSGIGAKIDPLVANDKPPFSWMLETSPGNYQCGYLFRDPVTDTELLSRFNDAMIYQGMCSGTDPGQRGTTRYMRLPNGSNNKSKYGEPFQCKLVTWNPERQYTIDELIQGWGLTLDPAKPNGSAKQSQRETGGLDVIELTLEKAGLRGPDQGNGFYGCPCPNEAEHTIADGRTGYDPEQGFKCFHGSCETLNRGDLVKWLKENHLEPYLAALEERNSDPEYAESMFGPPKPEGWKPAPIPEPPMGIEIAATPAPLNPTMWGELDAMEFAVMQWLVHELLPPGATLLVGRPKLGKSWLVLAIALLVAAGKQCFGKVTPKAGALYLALEDSDRRIKQRVHILMKSLGITSADIHGTLATETKSPMLGGGFEKWLSVYLAAKTTVRLVIIDVLAKVRMPRAGNQSVYADDYEVGKRIHDIAAEHPEVAFIVVHHANKSSAGGVEAVSGTNGLAGGFDNIFSMLPTADGVVLEINGRDIADDAEIPLVKDAAGMWTMEARDTALERTRSDTRNIILEAIRGGCEAPKDIILETGFTEGTVNQQLRRMVKDGTLAKPKQGKYKINPYSFSQVAETE